MSENFNYSTNVNSAQGNLSVSNSGKKPKLPSIAQQFDDFLKRRGISRTTHKRHLRALSRIQERYHTLPEHLSVKQVRDYLQECKKSMPHNSCVKHISGLSLFYRHFLQINQLAFDKYYLNQPQLSPSASQTEVAVPQHLSQLRQRMIEDMVLAGLNESTRQNYIRQIQAVQGFFNKHPARVTDEEIRHYLLWLRDGKHVAKGTFLPALAAMKMFYLQTLKRDTKVFERVGKPKQKRLPRSFADEQIQKLFATMKKDDARLCSQCMYMMGMRISEAVKISIEDIDASKMTVRILGKGNRDRYVPLPRDLLILLRKYWATHRHPRWLFPNSWRRKHFSDTAVRNVMNAAKKEAGLPKDLTPHALRHSYATRLTEAGVSLEVVRVLMGHSSVKTTQIYLHLTEPIRQQTRQKINELFSFNLNIGAADNEKQD